MSDRSEAFIPGAAVTAGALIVAAAVAVVFLEPPAAPAPPATQAPVRLVVLVVFDQLRADLIDKWRGEFGPDGFRRLQDDGAWFTDCHYPYAVTATGPGHAAMLSGAPPAVTGIVNNEWYDRQAAGEAYCAGDLKFAIVPPPPKVEPIPGAPARKPKQAGAPTRLLTPTVADVLKETTGGAGKVFGVSLKDRSGILPSGKKPDGVFWFDGRFVTSTYYADAVPGWVKAFNESGRAESYCGTDWTRLKSEELYDKLAGPDKADGEGTGAGQGVTFPHPMNGGKDKQGKPFADVKSAGAKYYEAVANSPYGNDLLLAFAKTCVEEEKLGADDVPDLLTVSFSSNDLVGHCWGPDSHEVLDCTLRSDAVLAELLAHLDATVGKGQYAVVLTADHGVCPLPEFSAHHTERYPGAKEAKRVPLKALRQGAEEYLRETFGKPDDPLPTAVNPKSGWVEAVSPPYLYLNHKLVKDRGHTPDAVAAALAKWVRGQDGVDSAYTATELGGMATNTTPVGERVRQSFHPDRSGDVYVVLKPYNLFGEPGTGEKVPTGTSHGAPHGYDTHVPLLVYGPGVGGGKREEKVTPLHAAPVAAHFLGVPRPAQSAYPLPTSLVR